MKENLIGGGGGGGGGGGDAQYDIFGECSTVLLDVLNVMAINS